MSLKEYAAKRDFRRTSEPQGKKGKAVGVCRFVIQKHAASHLHYDFRLEAGGTLKSWAVPKGVPLKKGEKRLAVQVEDHPLDYAAFEGTIPRGEYGGGTVMVWDSGTYENLGSNTLTDLTAGKLHFALHGAKLEGQWTLVRTSREGGKQWLLIKTDADLEPLTSRQDDESALSGRTLAQIAGGSERRARSKSAAAKIAQPSARAKPSTKAACPAKPDFIEPMKATLVAEPPDHGEWDFELKFDGYRVIALKHGDSVQLLSRNGKDFAGRYTEVALAVATLPLQTAVLDGEIVALDPVGRPSFQLLQGFETGAARPPLAFYIFDFLRQNSADLTALPLHERRQRLEKLIALAPEPLRYSATIEGDPRQMLKAVGKLGLEGLIGKQRNSVYQPGARSRAWIKLKCLHEQEFVIGGYTRPQGARQHFGALLVGVYENKELRFAGKVGTGFNAKLLGTIRHKMAALQQEKCPFADLPEKKQGRWAQNITPREMALCHWLKPRLVCQLRFTEWTADGKLRHPAFVGLRVDKPAREVTRERAV